MRTRLLALAIFLTACVGTIDELPENPEVEAPNSPPSPAKPVDSAFRRLTHAQFRQAATEVFQLDDLFLGPQAENSLEAESNINGLNNDSASQLVNQALMGGYLAMASRAADHVLDGVRNANELRVIMGCEEDDPLFPCVFNFQKSRMSRAYRRPLAEEDITRITELNQQVLDRVTTRPIDMAIEQVRTFVIALLISPEFLFMVERGSSEAVDGASKLTPYELATRLSFTATNSLPDAELLAAAESLDIYRSEVRVEQLRRLLQSESSKSALVDLLVHWFEVDVENVDLGQRPGLSDAELKASAMEEFRGFMDAWLFSGRSFEEFYASEVAVRGEGGQTHNLNVGALGLQAFIASHTTRGTPTPISRGAFVITRLLCNGLPAPPADVPDPPPLVDGLAQRDWLAQHRDASCASCHNLIDNYGFPFLNYNLSSEYVFQNEDGSEIDASATLPPIRDLTGQVEDLEAFSSVLAQGDESRRCMTDFWYRHAYGRTALAGDNQAIDEVMMAWKQSDGSAISLLEHIVAAEEFTLLRNTEAGQ